MADSPLQHICTLPTYWMPYVAIGTMYICDRCDRMWWLNEERLWQKEDER